MAGAGVPQRLALTGPRMDLGDRLLAWLSAAGPVAPGIIFLLVLAESGLMLAVPGETAVLVGGALASDGRISLPVLGIAAVAGAVAGDSLGYLLGRGPGRRRFFATGRFLFVRDRHVERVEELLRQRGVAIVLATRYLPVVRIAGPFAYGLVGLRPARFFPLMLAADVVWGLGVSALGYALGGAWSRLHVWIGRAGLLLLAIVGAAGWYYWRRTRKERSPP